MLCMHGYSQSIHFEERLKEGGDTWRCAYKVFDNQIHCLFPYRMIQFTNSPCYFLSEKLRQIATNSVALQNQVS